MDMQSIELVKKYGVIYQSQQIDTSPKNIWVNAQIYKDVKNIMGGNMAVFIDYEQEVTINGISSTINTHIEEGRLRETPLSH